MLKVNKFYWHTWHVTIHHQTQDGREFIVRYGEVDPNGIVVKAGDTVKQGQIIAKTGKLIKSYTTSGQEVLPSIIPGVKPVYMLHFELFTGENGLDLDAAPLSNDNAPYQRRSDLIDPLNVLQEGYRNTFENSGQSQINITVPMLKRVFTGLANTTEKDALLQEIADQINQNAERYQLNTNLRLSHFFAQVQQEIGVNCNIVENLNYSVSGLINTFGYFARNTDEADLYGRTATQVANQEAIANRAYANRIGNGDVASGDGWSFRGRGLKHLTGRDNYRSFTNYHRTFSNEDINFENTPDLLTTNYVYTVRSGVYFWL